jgi:hypothetical protein
MLAPRREPGSSKFNITPDSILISNIIAAPGTGIQIVYFLPFLIPLSA